MQIRSVVKRDGALQPFAIGRVRRSVARAMLRDEHGTLLTPRKRCLNADEQAMVKIAVSSALVELRTGCRRPPHVQDILAVLFRSLLAADYADAAWRMVAYRQRRETEKALAGDRLMFEPLPSGCAPCVVTMSHSVGAACLEITVPIDAGEWEVPACASHDG